MARYLPDQRALFQHIPRTAGTWVESAFSDLSGVLGFRVSRWLEKQPDRLPRKHSLLQHYHLKDLCLVDTVFTFVRHPFDLYESHWKWFVSRGRQRTRRLLEDWDWHPQASAARVYLTCRAKYRQRNSFALWVETMIREEPAWATRLYELYCGPEGGEFCNFIGRTETLPQDLLSVLGLLGIDCSPIDLSLLQRRRKENEAKGELSWNGIEDKLRQVERRAINRFYGGVGDNPTIGRRIYVEETLSPA